MPTTRSPRIGAPTIIDLTAVCTRHGITLSQLGTDEWAAVHHDVSNRAYVDYGVTDADAACALLIARWGITTHLDTTTRGWPWIACAPPEMRHDGVGLPASEGGETKLAAVVALADWLAGAKT